jgi:adenylate cyclase
LRGDHEGARAEAERAVALCPNLSTAQMQKGAGLLHSGRPREGLAILETAIRLDPQSSTRPIQLIGIVIGHYYCRDYQAAADAAKRAIHSYPAYPRPYYWLAAALGQLGQTEEAKKRLDEAAAMAPVYFDLSDRPPWRRPEDHAHMLEGLRKAGWQG